jgi:WD40 repeat protein
MEHDGGSVRSARFSRDGKRVVTAGTSLAARVWDAETGHLLAEPMRHGAALCDAQFSPDGRRVVTASRDGTARVWDTQTGQPLSEPMKHGGSVLSAQFSPDGRRVLTASSDQTVRIWDIAPSPAQYPDWLLPLAEAIGGQVISQRGVLEPTKLKGVETLNQIRQRLNQETGEDDWLVWGRWILADRATRTISPFSKITIPQYIENRIMETTSDSLAEAERLAEGRPELSQRIAKARKLLEQIK